LRGGKRGRRDAQSGVDDGAGDADENDYMRLIARFRRESLTTLTAATSRL
jgi:hypothetical protein